MRAYLKKKESQGKGIFKIRSAESSRLEQLSDSVFALGITLLLISPQVPRTAEELIYFSRDILAFLCSTAVIILIWYRHYLYFLRYNLRDTKTIVLNAILLMVVLFYVYPLKFLINFLLQYFGYLAMYLLGFSYDNNAMYSLLTETISWETLPATMIIYNGGYVALMLTYALLYRHAVLNKNLLELSPLEYWHTRSSMFTFFIQSVVGMLAVFLAIAAGVSTWPWLGIVSGYIYVLVGPIIWLFSKQLEKSKPKPAAIIE